MEKINEFLKKWGMLIILPMVLISFFKSCSTSTNINTLNKKVDNLKQTIDSNYFMINKIKKKFIKILMYCSCVRKLLFIIDYN